MCVFIWKAWKFVALTPCTLFDRAQSLRARRRARPFPNASEVQLELLHQEEGSGASSTFEQRAVRGGDAGPDPYPSPSSTGIGVGHALLEDVHSALYVPRGHLTLALNFPVRGEQVRGPHAPCFLKSHLSSPLRRVPQFHGCVDAAMVLEHEGQYSFHGPTPLHEQVHAWLVCLPPCTA